MVLHLVSAVWYERQRSRYHKHWLWQLEQVAGLTPLEQGCAGFHANSGRGAPVVHPVPRLVRALLVRHLRDLCQGLLTELAELDPVRHQQVLTQLNEAALFGQKGDKITSALKADEGAERLQTVVNAALEYTQTDQFKQEMKQRPLIERIIFNLTHFFGARYARSTGLPKANLQLRMAAAAFNLRQLIRLPRRPSLAAA